MKFNFKKISAIGSSVLLAGMSVAAPIAAANYPAPFVVGGSANVAIVYGTGPGAMDSAATANVGSDLQSYLSGGTSGTTSTVSGGDSLLLAKSSDNLNIGNTWGVFTGSVTEDDLSTLLADGTYVADDNDEFDYEQKITLGAPTLTHFRDSDYETLIGASVKTPAVGFKLTSNTFVMNYTLDFLQDAETTTGTDLTDIEGSDLTLLGKTYFVSDLKNGSSTSTTGKLTLLDSANKAEVSEGETVTVTVGDKSYDVSITFIDSANVKFDVNGETVPPSGKLAVGGTSRLSDGAYLGVRDISKLQVAGEIGSAGFSIGTGKLEITSGSDIKINGDTTLTGLKGWVYKASESSTGVKLDKIDIEWRVDEESYLSPEQELLMPGFEAVKFSMNPLVRSTEEKVTVQKSDDQKMELRVPIKDGEVSFNFLYGNASGEFTGLGEDSTNQLKTTTGSSFTFTERDSSGSDQDAYFVASYNITGESESYLLRAKVTQDTTDGRNETTIQKKVGNVWTDVCEGKAEGETCNIGDVSLTISTLAHTSGGAETVEINGSSNVNFHTIFTDGGLQIALPVLVANGSSINGGINLSAEQKAWASGGHNFDTFYLWFYSENKDDDRLAGTNFNMTIDDTSDGRFEVSQVNNAGTGGPSGLENEVIADAAYEYYIAEDVGTRIVHYTKADEDTAEVYYATGDSETYAEVFLAEAGAVITAGTKASTGSGAKLGDVYVTDSEVSSVITKELVIVGGSCINSAAATALGVTYPTCGADFTAATDVGTGEFLIKGVADKFATGKLALVVAGYDAADTSNAVTYLTRNTVDTSKEYKGTSSTSASLVVAEA